ncbi:cytochrome c biogenesis CcdA family protein [Desulfosporosinus metallidurans]|uniref:Cytochrome c-type biogenesis protein CcdA n=1 Tax=Desulfosporosinus metallidurans TaxID=1888891 RepID=A0A1Q8R040_9FIRM|nr:Cytochrome c-type biogenesis protein CcdA [Desulfosporosinus metallidurans]
MINQWLDILSTLISQSMWVAPVLALLAGMLTSLTPCSLSSVPLVIGYVGGTGNHDPKKAFWLSLTFSAGSAVTFTTLGVASSLVGKLMGTSSSWWYLLLGVLMVLNGLANMGDI